MLLFDHPASVNLRRLLWVRMLLLGALLGLLLLVHLVLQAVLPWVGLLSIAGVLLLLSLLSWWRLHALAAPVRELEVLAQLGLDIAALTWLLYLTGGWTNPLISLYLVPIAVAVVSLSATSAWLVATLAVVCYTALIRFHQPLALFQAELGAHDAHGGMDHSGFSVHMLGMWLTFVLSAGLITYFGIAMASTLRLRAAALARMREENLRNEQIMGVATLAAGTAHELGTPLTSIAVIAGELRTEVTPAQAQELELLLEQVAACRESLQRLRQAAAASSDNAAPLSVQAYMEALWQRWQVLRPQVQAQLDMPAQAGPILQVDSTLAQALLNLLNNAADASPAAVHCQVRWDSEYLTLDIRDQGPGFDADLAQLAEPAPRASQGMGMGLMLANASIERLGGSVQIRQRPEGGAWVRVRLPLARLAPAATAQVLS